MAAMTDTQRSKVRCKYFLHGVCNKDSCPFSHDIKDKPSMVCSFYLKGDCSYGKQCRYDHVKPDYIKKPEKVLYKVPDVLKEKKAGKEVKPSDWWIVNAPVFEPGKKHHRTLSAQDSLQDEETTPEKTDTTQDDHSDAAFQDASSFELTPEEISHLMCPFAAVRECPYGDSCHYVHGLRCDICDRQCLNPLDPEQQIEHRRNCLDNQERDMEYSFAIQRSENVSCCICMDVVLERESFGEQRFGILENCNHTFCLQCIRKWRQSSGGKKEVKACPICRVNSGFVIPSEIWIDDPIEKQSLIEDYTKALSAKDCKYFDKGLGDCPFGTSCFYRHAYGDGRLEEKEKPKMRFCEDSDGNAKVVRSQRLWDFIAEREMQGVSTD
ncbi:probable E3 ubiquitin-protein ligase makorin-1 [Rhopilema esculentum]|uniref:probable E3 ubiquitin-protein ligase makorin-1 n=1 Tax=Rhopilema esculentum TaxID=499914 RepID=UPI0031E3AB67